MNRARAGEKVSVKQQVKKGARADKEVALAERTIAAPEALGTRLYGVILADPPWRFEPYSRETGMDRAVDNHYPTMGLDAIKALRVLGAEDCVLYLWATIPMLPQALDVMATWGFSYKSGHVSGMIRVPHGSVVAHGPLRRLGDDVDSVVGHHARVGSSVPRGTGGSTADRERARRSTPAGAAATSGCAMLTRSSNARDHPGLTASRPGHRVGLDGDPLAWGDRRGRTTDRGGGSA